MSVTTRSFSKAEKCIQVLSDYMYAQKERPTGDSLSKVAVDQGEEMLKPNVLASYFGTVDKALDKAEAYLRKTYPEWTPPWSCGKTCRVKIKKTKCSK